MTAPSINPPTPPYLADTTIHEIFREENFTDPTPRPSYPEGLPLTAAQYHQLAPALRLASKFLTNSACLPWWTTLILSTPVTDAHTQRAYLPRVASTPETRARAQHALRGFASRVRFRFPKLDFYTRDAYGMSKPVGDAVLITLHGAHLDHLKSEAFAAAPESRRLCFFAHVALTLVHEVAHGVAGLAHGPGAEPFHGVDEPEAEMGSSWEWFVFNGKMQPLNGMRTAERGLVWWCWVDVQTHFQATLRQDLRFWGVYMAWVEGLFRELTWRKVEALGMGEMEVRTCGDRARSCYDREGYWGEIYRMRRGRGAAVEGEAG